MIQQIYTVNLNKLDIGDRLWNGLAKSFFNAIRGFNCKCKYIQDVKNLFAFPGAPNRE